MALVCRGPLASDRLGLLRQKRFQARWPPGHLTPSSPGRLIWGVATGALGMSELRSSYCYLYLPVGMPSTLALWAYQTVRAMRSSHQSI
jgi:hypothetical protein